MDRTILKSFSLGSFFTNCYLLFNEDTKDAIIIDAPEDILTVCSYIKDNNLKVHCVMLTHGHIDHIKGLNQIEFPFYIHREDRKFLVSPGLNLSSLLLEEPFKVGRLPLLLNEKILRLGSFEIEVIHTPGHTPGSVSFKLRDWLFCGDTLFFDSIGRVDLPYASYPVLISSIKEKIVSLKDQILVFPGHGPSTTIKREKEFNPFLVSDFNLRK